MLEGLVTTLLSLDYLHQQHKPENLLSAKVNFQQAPSRCRSNSLVSASSSDSDSDTASSASTSTTIMGYCPPCDGMEGYYDHNDTVFGAILRGELPSTSLAESSRLLALEDIQPRAPLHALVIPKAFVGSVFDIDQGRDDLEWMQEMHDMALQLVQTHHPEAYANNDYRLCFHIPPFNSVDHLHLHVLAPVSQMPWYYKYIKYNPHTRWCIDMEHVLQRLERGDAAVPYRRPPTSKPQKETMGLFLLDEDEARCASLEETPSGNRGNDKDYSS